MDRTTPAKNTTESKPDMPLARRILISIGLPAWVLIGFLGASLLASLIVIALAEAGIISESFDTAILNSVVAALAYVLTLVIVIGVPWKLRAARTTKEELGLSKLPTWFDIVIAPAAFVIYMILAGVLLAAVTGLFPGFDSEEAQDVGFENLSQSYEYILAFITLVIVAPVAEEVLLRGYLYGKLRKVTSLIVALLISSLLFSAMHMQWNVALNVLPLGIVMVVLREMTGSIWAGILLHMIKNGVAYYLLFVNPSFINTIGG